MRDRHYKLVATLMFVFLGLWAIISLFPYYFQFITGFKGIEEVNRITPTFWPDEFLWSNLDLIFSDETNVAALLDTLLIASANTALAVFLGSLAGYALARFPRQAGGENMAFWILSNRMFPPVAILLPMFRAFDTVLGSTDNHLSLIILYLVFNMPLATWLMMVFFRDAPRELEEAAYLDGYSPLRAFFKVTLPQVVPGMMSVALLCWIFAWNEYLFANMLVGSNVAVNTIQMPGFVQGAQKLWNLAALFSLVAVIPPVVLFMVRRRYMVRGLSLGVVKG